MGRSQRPSTATRSAGLKATKLKTKGRVSVRLNFRLAKADRVFLIVRGPYPSCQIAGYIPVRGRKGVNKVAFAGRVHGRRLDPGVYLISLSPNRRLVPGAPTEYVRVVSPRRSLPLPDSARKPSCNEASALAASPFVRFLVGEESRPVATPSALPTAPKARPVPTLAGVGAGPKKEADEPLFEVPNGGLLGEANGGGALLERFVVVMLIGAFALAMLALVSRFVRSNWRS